MLYIFWVDIILDSTSAFFLASRNHNSVADYLSLFAVLKVTILNDLVHASLLIKP